MDKKLKFSNLSKVLFQDEFDLELNGYCNSGGESSEEGSFKLNEPQTNVQDVDLYEFNNQIEHNDDINNCTIEDMNVSIDNVLNEQNDTVYLDDNEQTSNIIKEGLLSPSYMRKVKELNLLGSPRTPKTLFNGANKRNKFACKSRILFGDNDDVTPKSSLKSKGQKRRYSSPKPNINPFTPTGMLLQKKKRKVSSLNGSLLNPDVSSVSDIMNSLEDSEDDIVADEEMEHNLLFTQLSPSKQTTSNSRYNSDFVELSEIGKGEFGSVYKCLNRLDGCIYALKKNRKPLHGSISEKRALNEVYAHAVLGKHPRVVQYYSAWAEDNHMYIQNEYCDGGSLYSLLLEKKAKGERFTETQLKKILVHIIEGLKYIHSLNLVHLDIKSANIFISRNVESVKCNLANRTTESSDDGFEDCLSSSDNEEINNDDVTYKIGDLGHVTSVIYPQVEEGDCRYMALELLHENYAHLRKADIFSLGLTIYELASMEHLPKNGDKWHELRKGQIPKLTHYSDEFNKLIKKMLHKEPINRPTTTALSHHPFLVPNGDKSRAQLRKELNMAQLRIGKLSQQLEDAKRLRSMASTTISPKNKAKSFCRSRSVTFF